MELFISGLANFARITDEAKIRKKADHTRMGSRNGALIRRLPFIKFLNNAWPTNALKRTSTQETAAHGIKNQSRGSKMTSQVHVVNTMIQNNNSMLAYIQTAWRVGPAAAALMVRAELLAMRTGIRIHGLSCCETSLERS